MVDSDETSLERLNFCGSGKTMLARLSFKSDSYTSHVTLKLPTLNAIAEKVGPRCMISLLTKISNYYNISSTFTTIGTFAMGIISLTS